MRGGSSVSVYNRAGCVFPGAEAALSARAKRRAELLCGEDAAERP